jgi:hypothetical protein
MTLFHTVTDLVTQLGSATCDEIYPHVRLKGYTRKQVIQSMAYARKLGLIHCMGRVPRAFKKGAGSEPTRHYPGKKPAGAPKATNRRSYVIVAPPASVWELGQTQTKAWPPVGEGRRFNLLGAWDS